MEYNTRVMIKKALKAMASQLMFILKETKQWNKSSSKMMIPNDPGQELAFARGIGEENASTPVGLQESVKRKREVADDETSPSIFKSKKVENMPERKLPSPFRVMRRKPVRRRLSLGDSPPPLRMVIRNNQVVENTAMDDIDKMVPEVEKSIEWASQDDIPAEVTMGIVQQEADKQIDQLESIMDDMQNTQIGEIEMVQIKHDQKEPSDEPWIYMADDGSQDADLIRNIAEAMIEYKKEEIQETIEDIRLILTSSPQVGVLTVAKAEVIRLVLCL